MASLYLNKNRNKSIRKVSDKTLFSSGSSKSVNYYYIDLNKFNETEVIINLYQQDIEISKPFYFSDNGIEEADLPTEFISLSNYFTFTQLSKEDCGFYCRIYLAVQIPRHNNELYTTFSISYLSKSTQKSETNINLPLNYYSQYSFADSDLNEVNYYVKHITGNINIKLKVIKQNESNNDSKVWEI